MNHEDMTPDDRRRALEALGLTRGTDRSEMTRAMLDAYSEVWVPSRHLQQDHEQALIAAALAAAPWVKGDKR